MTNRYVVVLLCQVEQQMLTAAQRRELYALNDLMTRTEQNMFRQNCLSLGLLSSFKS
jgi:hypothetical protein